MHASAVSAMQVWVHCEYDSTHALVPSGYFVAHLACGVSRTKGTLSVPVPHRVVGGDVKQKGHARVHDHVERYRP